MVQKVYINRQRRLQLISMTNLRNTQFAPPWKIWPVWSLRDRWMGWHPPRKSFYKIFTWKKNTEDSTVLSCRIIQSNRLYTVTMILNRSHNLRPSQKNFLSALLVPGRHKLHKVWALINLPEALRRWLIYLKRTNWLTWMYSEMLLKTCDAMLMALRKLFLPASSIVSLLT